MVVDSHAHLDDARFAADREQVLERAWQEGVRRILTIGNGTGPDDMTCGFELAREYDWIHTTVGVHPHDAARMEPRHLAMAEELASDDRVLAIGEAGLDYHYDNSPREIQRAVFEAQIDLANRCDLPIVIHTREADEDTIRILEERRPRRGVIHCFTSGATLAERALDLGLMMSFSGILTFKRTETIRDVAARVPEDRLLVETDCPYLAPVPDRGRRNEPAFVTRTAEVLSEIRGVPLAELFESTTRNFERLFEPVFS
jgi:TatD DNase family protein